ncbi:MAG: TlpA family protein disulfide reductase [Chloroflexi bacterium]|nr:TlpA family protein disulfide reductase [Chloroflexota bacterium]
MANRRRRKNTRVSGAARQGALDRKKNLVKFGLGAVGSIAIIALIVFAVAAGTSSGGEGSEAPDFEVSLFQGVEKVGFREGKLSALHGRPMVLNFWAGLCPPCRAEMPQFQAFYEDFQDEVMLLGVDIGIFTGLGSHDDADSLLRELGVTYPAGWTDDRSITSKYGVTAMPTTVFISSDGTIFEKSVGAIDANFLARTSQELLAAESTALNHGGS